jgi:hypothetical protein
VLGLCHQIRGTIQAAPSWRRQFRLGRQSRWRTGDTRFAAIPITRPDDLVDAEWYRCRIQRSDRAADVKSRDAKTERRSHHDRFGPRTPR